MWRKKGKDLRQLGPAQSSAHSRAHLIHTCWHRRVHTEGELETDRSARPQASKPVSALGEVTHGRIRQCSPPILYQRQFDPRSS